MLAIDGFREVSVLAEGPESRLVRAANDGGETVLIKTTTRPRAKSELIASLEREFELEKSLDHAALVAPLRQTLDRPGSAQTRGWPTSPPPVRQRSPTVASPLPFPPARSTTRRRMRGGPHSSRCSRPSHSTTPRPGHVRFSCSSPMPATTAENPPPKRSTRRVPLRYLNPRRT